MKTIISAALLAALAAPVMADMADTLTKTVDDKAASTKSQTDSSASKANGAITNTMGNNAVSNAATAKVDATSGSAKSKTDAGAGKVKHVISKTQTHKQAAQKSADSTIQNANTAATNAQNSAAQAIQNAGK